MPTETVVDVGAVPMSALVRKVREPRAVVLALHGGAATAPYFHYPGLPWASLLETGAALGYTVIALDRPGYGRSAPAAEEMWSAGRRVDLAYEAVEEILGPNSRGAGLFVLAHSAGAELAVRMAADERGKDLLGLELAGTGRQFHPGAERVLRDRQNGNRKFTGLQDILWQPSNVYPAEVLGGTHFVSPAPAYEADVLGKWAPRDFALCAAQVQVPVQYTLGEQDTVWRTDPEALADIASLFTAAPRFSTVSQPNSGHNLSVGLTARAYHLRALSFVEECVVAREGDRFD